MNRAPATQSKTRALLVAVCSVILAIPTPAQAQSADELADALDAISADSLRGHLSFIASDALGGRDTPSPGLDMAAEYIAAQFRRAGLEPLGDDGFFQTTTMEVDDPQPDDLTCSIDLGGQIVNMTGEQMSVVSASEGVSASGIPGRFVSFPVGDVEPADEGRYILLTNMPSRQSVPRDGLRDYFRNMASLSEYAQKSGAVAILNLDLEPKPGAASRGRRRARAGAAPVFTLHGRDIANAMGFDGADWPPMDGVVSVDLHYTAPAKREVAVRNVVGLLRGSDPELSETYILLTAHYDHVGIGAAVDGDSIYNGANDDGSGTVSVMELAAALSRLKERPRRSIIFMCFYGEERGMLGSRHYAENPLVPLTSTIANINLEHLGRTDDSEGPSVRRIMPTGFDYSTAVAPFVVAGEELGISVYHHPRNSASFFGRSDNVALASHGIPAHSFCAAFIFPDYHGAGDHWELVDFENLAAIDRMLALGLVRLANQYEVPVWNPEVRGVKRYFAAWKELHGVDEGEDGG